MNTIKLPRKHAQDWLARYDGPDCGEYDAREVSRTARTITLELGDNALRDLISDALYYAEEMDRDNTGDLDYRPAARACLRGIDRIGIGYDRGRGYTVHLTAPVSRENCPNCGHPQESDAHAEACGA